MKIFRFYFFHSLANSRSIVSLYLFSFLESFDLLFYFVIIRNVIINWVEIFQISYWLNVICLWFEENEGIWCWLLYDSFCFADWRMYVRNEVISGRIRDRQTTCYYVVRISIWNWGFTTKNRPLPTVPQSPAVTNQRFVQPHRIPAP